MGTTAEKLTYLNTTKQNLKTVINTTGAGLTDESTFRSYANVLNDKILGAINGDVDLFEEYPKVSGNGTDLSLNGVVEGKMSITPQGVSSQDGEPTPTTPIPVNNVTGENSVVINSANLFNKDSGFRLGYINTSGTFVSATATACFNQYIPCQPNTNYTISFNKNISSLGAPVYYTINKTFLTRETALSSVSKRTFTTPENCYYIVIQFNADGSTMTQEKIDGLECQLVKGSTAPTTYVPHEEQNYQLSLGNIELNSTPDGTIRDGIIGSSDVSYNLFDGARKNVYFNNQKQFASGIADALTTNYIPASEGDIFTISTEQASSGIVIASFDENYNCLSRSAVGETSLKLTYTCPANTKYIIGSNFIGMTTNTTLVEGSEAKPYFPYGQVGMWYKREYIGKVVLDGSETWSISTTQDGNYRYHKENFIDAKNDIGYCTHFKIGNIADRNASGQINKFFVGSITPAPQTLQFVSDITTVANFKAFLQTQYNNNNPVTVYYEHIENVDNPITDTTLINQLNDIYNNAHSYNGVTNITTTYASGNEQMYLDIEALKNVWDTSL